MEVSRIAEAEGPLDMFGVYYWRHCVQLDDGRHGHLWIPLSQDELWDEAYTIIPDDEVLDMEAVEVMLAEPIHEVDSAAFDRVWDVLADQGACDSRGGAEYHRIQDEWATAGFPTPLARFIRQSANYVPGITSPSLDQVTLDRILKGSERDNATGS